MLFASSAGFGLNLDILGSNLLNILAVLGILIYLGRSVISNILDTRKTEIITAIEEAEQANKAAEAELAKQKKNLEQAQKDAEAIVQQAKETAEATRAEILGKVDDDIAKLKAAADKEIAAERDRAIAQLRRKLVKDALEKVESELPQRITDDAQSQLIDSSIQLLGGN